MRWAWETALKTEYTQVLEQEDEHADGTMPMAVHLDEDVHEVDLRINAA